MIEELKMNSKYTGNITTYCNACDFTCHDNCSYQNDDEKDKCCVILNENCTVCEKRCHYKNHTNIPNKMVYSFVRKTISTRELEVKYYDCKNQQSKYDQILNKIRIKYDELSLKTLETQETLKNTIDKMMQMSLNRNSFDSSEEFLEWLIKCEEEKKREGYEKRILSIKHLIECHTIVSNLFSKSDKKENDYEKFKKQFWEEKKKMINDNQNNNVNRQGYCLIF